VEPKKTKAIPSAKQSYTKQTPNFFKTLSTKVLKMCPAAQRNNQYQYFLASSKISNLLWKVKLRPL